MKVSLEKIFSWYVALIPILIYYRSPLQAFNLATFLALLFGSVFFFRSIVKQRIKFKLSHSFVLIYFVFLLSNVLVTSTLYSYSYNWQNFSSLVRTVIIISCIFLIGYEHFKLEEALKCLSGVLSVSAVLIVFQTVLRFFTGQSIKFVLASALAETGYGRAEAGTRFSGLYMEPSHYAQSAVIYLLISVLIQNGTRIKISKTQLLVMIGVIFSGSGQGYAYLVIIWIVWFVYYLFITKATMNKIVKSILVVASLGVCIIFVLRIDTVQYALSRIIASDGTIGGRALAGRTWTNSKFAELSPLQKWIGVGYGQIGNITGGYVNSLYSHLIQCGYISLPFLYSIFIPPILRKKPINSILAIMIIVMTFFTSIGESVHLCFCLLFIYSDYADLKEQHSQDEIRCA